MLNFVWLIPFFPLIGFAVIGLLGSRFSKNLAAVIGCVSVLLSFILSCGVFVHILGSETKSFTLTLFSWIHAGDLSADFSFLVDPLSSVFLLIITGVGFLIHVYSVGYMRGDMGFARFFAQLNLFVFFMLVLVLGSNYLIMFVGWEGVGLCSYLLIGFWFKNAGFNRAANKAFIMNRIGDLGFLLGIILIYITFGSVDYSDVFDTAKSFQSDKSQIIAITLLLFIGACGKSAQVPLYTWLPDAMAGPTPVSALIHAATMVTAGVYMVARSNILYTVAPASMEIVAGIGLFTAILAATIGLAQNDIKKVLAYSTVSQLGYMFLALGVGAYSAGVFHVTTHAFFKALLFLAAGSVIHALGNEQDIRSMGGLKKYLPITYFCFFMATLAISGVPPFSGFFSKDEILSHAFEHNGFLWFLGVMGACITAFYMFRLLYLTFFGEFRGSDQQKQHLHESPKVMTIPLIILAVLSLTGGFIGIPGDLHALKEFLAPVFYDSEARIIRVEHSSATEYVLIGISAGVVLLLIYAAYAYYLRRGELPADEGEELSPAHRVVYRKYFVDELYDAVIARPLDRMSAAVYRFAEQQGIDAAVNFMGKFVDRAGALLRHVQSGYTGFYVFAMVISIILMLVFAAL
jgi:NADH-quinone oxidoreductase subunit L